MATHTNIRDPLGLTTVAHGKNETPDYIRGASDQFLRDRGIVEELVRSLDNRQTHTNIETKVGEIDYKVAHVMTHMPVGTPTGVDYANMQVAIRSALTSIAEEARREERKSGIEECIRLVESCDTITGTDRHRKPADTGVFRKSVVLEVLREALTPANPTV